MADSPIVALAPTGTPEQASRFLLARPHGEYTERDVSEVIVATYFALCTRAWLDPIMVIAQMIHETGGLTSWWSQRPRRNPAGIGVTGRTRTTQPARGSWAWDGEIWREGVSFGSWQDAAIPAHVGRLLAYALPQRQTAHGWVIAGEPFQCGLIRLALQVRPLPERHRGAAPTWRGLNGRWAVPGTVYSDRIAAVAAAIRRG